MLKILTCIALLTSPALAQEAPNPNCAEYKSANEAFLKAGARKVAFGIIDGDAVMLVYVYPDDHWVEIIVSPNGKACLVKAGQAWASKQSPSVSQKGDAT